MTEPAMRPKEDNRPQRSAWAPGDYECRCINCEEAFIGDKRAVYCAECAYSTQPWERRVAALEARLATERAANAQLRAALERTRAHILRHETVMRDAWAAEIDTALSTTRDAT